MMQYMQTRIVVIVFMLVAVTPARAQDDVLAAIQKIYNAYNSGHVIRFAGNMKMYDKNDPAKIIEKMQSNYLVKDKNFSCSIGPVEMLLNDKYYVSVDNSDKLIMIGYKKDLSATAQAPVLNISQFKKMIADKKMEAVVSNKAGVAVLQLSDINGASGFTMYNIEYNAASGYMKKVILETGSNSGTGKTMVLEINYSGPAAVTDGKDVFSEKSFFSIVNNKIQVTANYKTYQIINQL
ncbi:MAG TPA: hypothetical protein VK645_10110 [Chitinophagaceae bacterium]|nr:hypothetical protein [Chitinophagaceae bacterium]